MADRHDLPADVARFAHPGNSTSLQVKRLVAPEHGSADLTPEVQDRSNLITFLSLALILGIFVLRIRFPELAREHMGEIRYLLALFASCFMLGISGWFECRKGARANCAFHTIIIMMLLVTLWEGLLSGYAGAMMNHVLAVGMMIARG